MYHAFRLHLVHMTSRFHVSWTFFCLSVFLVVFFTVFHLSFTPHPSSSISVKTTRLVGAPTRDSNAVLDDDFLPMNQWNQALSYLSVLLVWTIKLSAYVCEHVRVVTICMKLLTIILHFTFLTRDLSAFCGIHPWPNSTPAPFIVAAIAMTYSDVTLVQATNSKTIDVLADVIATWNSWSSSIWHYAKSCWGRSSRCILVCSLRVFISRLWLSCLAPLCPFEMFGVRGLLKQAPLCIECKLIDPKHGIFDSFVCVVFSDYFCCPFS